MENKENLNHVWTVQNELYEFIFTVKAQLEVIEKAAQRGECDGGYLAEKYAAIEKSAVTYQKRLTTYKKQMGVL